MVRGLRLLAVSGRQKWVATPKERRGPKLLLGAACVLVVALVPYGPILTLVTVMGAAAWKGRERTPVRTGPAESETARLRSLYEALVPYFSTADDPDPLFAHGGDWANAFDEYAFDADGRLTRLRISYPAYFTDGEAAARSRIEQLLHTKSGRGREYHFGWDEEANRLVMTVLDALPTTIAAQRFVTAPGETVLGFTDPDAVSRTVPVRDGDMTVDASPVVWRTGGRSTEPHLLAVGQPGGGTTTLVRSIALQALQNGDVIVVDGSGTGEYGALAGRSGVLAVESGLGGALATLEWAAHETERRLIAANRARQSGHRVPDDILRPLWILLDRPGVLGHLAVADGRPDPLELLRIPLRHGRAAQVTVVLAEQFDALDTLTETVRTHTRARAVLGPASREQIEAVLGAEPHTTPPHEVPRGAVTSASARARSCGSRCPPPRTRTTMPPATRTGRRCSTCCPAGTPRWRRRRCGSPPTRGPRRSRSPWRWKPRPVRPRPFRWRRWSPRPGRPSRWRRRSRRAPRAERGARHGTAGGERTIDGPLPARSRLR